MATGVRVIGFCILRFWILQVCESWGSVQDHGFPKSEERTPGRAEHLSMPY